MNIRTATSVINRQALLSNYQTIKSLSPDSKVLAVLKANAYGHGLVLIAKALAEGDTQPDAFGVARLDEALQLRSAGIVKPIVLLEGFFDADDVEILAANNLQTVIHNQQQLDYLVEAQLENPLKVWLKIDTGMHRLGINPEEFNTFTSQLTTSKNVQDDIVVMTHLACADDIHDDKTDHQLVLFTELTSGLTFERSCANSAGICAWPLAHQDWVRPGVMLYGISPMLKQSANELSLTPVMTLKSSLIAIRKIAKGESVGYGSSWKSQQATTIGVVAIGYGDGYPRHAENGTPVLINNRMVPLIGRVSMDMITVDLGEESFDKIGDIATLWGEGLPVEEVAQASGTIAYELLCNITNRVKKEVI